jgi:hypothetical protein
MTATRIWAGAMFLALGLLGCHRGLPEVEFAGGKPPPLVTTAAPGGEFDFATPTEAMDVAELLKAPRAELALRCDELEKAIRRKDQLRMEGKLTFALLPETRLPLVPPVFREAAYSKDRGMSLPPYVPVDGFDAAVAFHLARWGDLEGALRLTDPNDEDTVRLIRETVPQKSYPLEWTRLVSLLLHDNQFSLATDNKEGAKNLIALHMQLRNVLDVKAKQGPLGAVLLGRGLGTLKQAAAAWKASNRDDLDAPIKSFIASAGAPAYSVVMPRQMDELAQMFGARAGTMALIASAPSRVADLLNLYVPTDEADTCVAFGDDAKKVIEILFTYRPTLFDYQTAEQFTQPLDELLAGGKNDPAGGCPRRVWEMSRSRLEATLTPQHATLGGVVRLQAPGTARAIELVRDFGTVTLDHSFEAGRRMSAWTKRGPRVVLSEQAATGLGNPLKGRRPAQVVIEREPGHDLVKQIVFEYSDVKETSPAAGKIAQPMFANAGQPSIVFGDSGVGSIDFVWRDAKTRYNLRFPYGRDKLVALEVSDASKIDLARRADAAAANDAAARRARLQAQTPFSAVPRQLEGVKLGMSRADFKKALPRAPMPIEREFAGGLMEAYLGPPQSADAVAREWFGRFDNDRLAELRIRYVDHTANKPGTFNKKFDGLKKQLGAPESVKGTGALWADLPKRGNSVTHAWQDDVTTLTVHQEPYGLEIVLRDCPADYPEGAPLPPFAYLNRGVGDIKLGLTKEALVKLGAKPSEGNSFIIDAAGQEWYDAIVAWVEDGKVARIVARHKTPTALKAEAQASRTLPEHWARDSRSVGWPSRQDMIGPNLQSLATRDDITRYRIFWQEEPQGVSVFSEWKNIGN